MGTIINHLWRNSIILLLEANIKGSFIIDTYHTVIVLSSQTMAELLEGNLLNLGCRNKVNS